MTGERPFVGLVLTPALVAACWAAWAAGGWLARSAGLDEIETVGRLGAVFAFLAAAERVLARLRVPRSEHGG